MTDMTDPKPATAGDVMLLLARFRAECSGCGLITEIDEIADATHRKLELAIQRICDERDAAVKELAEKDLAEKVEYSDAYCDELKALLRVAHDEATRQIEALKAELAEFRAALLNATYQCWTREGVRVMSCIHCDQWWPVGNMPKHAPNCIVRKAGE